MPLIIGAKSATATGYAVDNSCRFNDGDSAYMTRAFDAAQTSTSIFTISVWVKRGTLGTRQSIFAAYDGVSEAGDDLEFETDDTLSYNGSGSSSSKLNTTSAVFRDPSAWYHIVVARNSGASGAANQVKIYVNGVLQTLGTNGGCDTSQFLQNGLNSRIGSNQSGGDYFVDMYMAEFVAIDGQMLDHTSFGEFDSDSPTIWKPKDPSGLTFGDNGFYLDFEDSGDLGDDESGNTNDFTESNLDATDQATDSPTNNFATMNPLDNYYAEATFAEGNCKITSDGTSQAYVMSTLGMTTSNWYWESKIGSDGALGNYQFGIAASPSPSAGTGGRLMNASNSVAVDDGDGNVYANGSSTGVTVGAFAVNDIVNYAYDCSNNAFYIGKNGTWLNSGDPTSGASKTGAFTPGTAGIPYFPTYGDQNGTHGYMMEYNFGGCSAFTVSSANQDADGYGNFEYAVPSGYYALCTKNLGAYGG